VVEGTGSLETSTAECPTESVLLGGGFQLTGEGGTGSPSNEDDVLSSQPNAFGTGWEAAITQLGDATESEIIAYAVCSVPTP
jgi:hypothetical protein